MKKTVLKRVIAVVLSLAMVVTGLYLVAPEAEEVQAAAEAGVTYKEYSTTAVANYWGKAPTDIPEGKVFAGWYKDAECTEKVEAPETEYVAGGKTYAKLVDKEIFALKMQLSEDGTKIRLVSSVDSLDYSRVGFEVVFNGQTVEWDTDAVLERINATNTGVEYKYSPKVVDAESEYFVTGTIAGINLEKYIATDFYVTPYVETLDGARSYGLSRMFSVEDGQAKDSFNIAIKGSEVAADTVVDVTVDGADAKATVVGYKDGYVHMNVTKAKAELASQAKVVYAGETAIYENLQSKADVDTSWYDANESTYYLATAADLRGFSQLSNNDGNSFSGKILILVSDIILNEGTAEISDNGWNPKTAADSVQWDPIGPTGNYFAGTFDGDGNTIKGIYINGASDDGVGLFGHLGAGSAIKNFKIEDSYIKAVDHVWIGAAAGRCLDATINSVYVGTGVVVYTNQPTTGGLVGRWDGTSSISQCQVAGHVYTTNTAGDGMTGGIVGAVSGSNSVLTMTDCLSTGSVRGGNWTTGGIIGGSAGAFVTLTLKNCLNTSRVSGNSGSWNAAICGGLNDTSIAMVQDVYTTTKATIYSGTEVTGENYPGWGGKGQSTVYGLVDVLRDAQGNALDLSGNNAYEQLAFDFYGEHNKDGVWVAAKNGTPELKVFSTLKDEEIQMSYDGGNEPIEHYGWYLAKIYKNGAIDRSAATTFEIESIEDLRGLATVLNTSITLDGNAYNENFAGDTVLLMNSVDANPGWDATTKQEPHNVWTPLGDATITSYAFSGTFDGQGNAIRGLYCSKSVNGAGGLFGKVANSAVIRNFTLENSYFASTLEGSQMGVGAVVTKAGDASLYDIYVDEDVYVYGAGMGVGGIVGQAGGTNAVSTFRMERCWFAGTVEQATNQDFVGGLIGFTNGTGSSQTAALLTTYVVDCLMTGTIIGGRYSTGGLLGEVNWGPQQINFSTSVYNGVIRDTTNTHWTSAYIGGIEQNKYNVLNYDKVYGVNMNYTNDGLVVMNSSNAILGYGGGSGNAVGTDTHNFKNVTVAEITGACALDSTALNFSETGVWVPTVYGPQLKAFAEPTTIVYDTTYTDWYESDPNAETFHIGTAAELYYFQDIANSGVDFTGKTIQLTADIDLNEGFDARTATVNTQAVKWDGITAFNGTFDGNYKTIEGVYFTGSVDKQGFFKKVGTSGVIKNLAMDNSYYGDTNAGWWYGALVGELQGNIENIWIKENVVLQNCLGDVWGGIVGYISTEGVKIKNCAFEGYLNLSKAGAGIIGRLLAPVTIENCYVAGTHGPANTAGIICQAGSSATDPAININIKACLVKMQSLREEICYQDKGNCVFELENVYSENHESDVLTWISESEQEITSAEELVATLGAAWTIDNTTGLPALIFKAEE